MLCSDQMQCVFLQHWITYKVNDKTQLDMTIYVLWAMWMMQPIEAKAWKKLSNGNTQLANILCDAVLREPISTDFHTDVMMLMLLMSGPS